MRILAAILFILQGIALIAMSLIFLTDLGPLTLFFAPLGGLLAGFGAALIIEHQEDKRNSL